MLYELLKNAMRYVLKLNIGPILHLIWVPYVAVCRQPFSISAKSYMFGVRPISLKGPCCLGGFLLLMDAFLELSCVPTLSYLVRGQTHR